MIPRNGLWFALLFLASSMGWPVDSTSPTYRLSRRYSIPGEGRGWDYIAVDTAARRLYVSHETQLEVLDADSGKLIGQITDTPGVHGAAIAPELQRGFTSNGRDNSVTIFDMATLKVIKKVSVNRPDFILYDEFSKRVFPMNEKITVLNAMTGERAGEVDLGGDPEAGVSDGKGTVYVNLADKAAVAAVDALTMKVTRTYPIDRCTSPHSLAFDAESQRLFVGCRDGLVVLDATNGKVAGRSLMCSGVDGVGWDPERKLIFEACEEGVISVIRQLSPDYYELVDTIKTELFARTMVFDSKTKNIYLPTADIETVPTSNSRRPFLRQMKPGTFRVLVVTP